MQIKFQPDQLNFYPSVKEKVAKYFEQNNLSKNANGLMVFKTVFYYTLFVGIYVLLLSGILPWYAMLPLVGFFGFIVASIGFNVAHDANHGAYSSNATINKILSYSFNLMGANSYMWTIMHNIVHHTYTNIPGHDEDLEPVPLIRLSTSTKLLKVQRYQQWYAPFFYGLGSLSWVLIKDYKKFFQKEIGNYQNKNHPIKEYFILFISKAVYYFIFLVLPMLVMPIPWWGVIIGFLTMHVVEGITMAFVFYLAHVVEGVAFEEPEPDGHMDNAWGIHQVITTADFSRKSKIANFLLGGLNFQIEHHLFPKVCHVHYKAISQIVKDTAISFQIPYYENRTFLSALRSHFRMLKKLGRQEELSLQ